MEIKPAHRIAQVKPYFFADLDKSIASLKKSGMDVIRLDIGSPDLPPADFIVDALNEAAKRPDMHGYAPSGGSVGLRHAFSKYYKDRFNLDLDPDKEVLGLIGSKEGLFNLSQVLLNPGDLALIPDPSYPVYEVGARIAMGETFPMPLRADNNFLPDFEKIPAEIVDRAKLMWLNYPNNPTGAVAPYSFFKEVVAFARQHQIVIAHDAPYVDVCFDDYQALSFLEVPGANEVGVEFNSLSKTYNMAGWRVGMVAGNPDIIQLLRTYKSQLDSSHFKPIMVAAETALLGNQSWIRERNMVYQRRRDIIVETLLKLGFALEIPKASLYVWARIPQRWQGSIEFCSLLLNEAGVSITPGVVYGESGEGFIRISLVTPEERLSEAMVRLDSWINEKV
ncbi:MAG: aminotransferase class I/II-fold pyridoxal phosphate-dependent enzyme [Brevefilum sp.]|jgi:LL-diaminopimelate aminotransferase